MKDRPPFGRLRLAGLVAIFVLCPVIGILNHTLKRTAADDVTDIGLCFIGFCAALTLVMHLAAMYMTNYKWEWRIKRVEDRVMGAQTISRYFDYPGDPRPTPRQTLAAVPDDAS